MTSGSIDQLTARQRDCLRLVARGMSSKEIALELGISHLTVDGYLKEAVRILGADSRRAAARALVESGTETPPQNLGAEPPGIAETVQSEPFSPQDRSEAQPRFRVPVLRQGRQSNDLQPLQRLTWILGLAMVMLIAVANFLNGLGALWRITS
jgi:DNA-binding CsgD family transcriptional regulator